MQFSFISLLFVRVVVLERSLCSEDHRGIHLDRFRSTSAAFFIFFFNIFYSFHSKVSIAQRFVTNRTLFPLEFWLNLN